MKFKPIKLTPLNIKPLVTRKDSDFDSLPDHLDCNPRNPFQQDNNSIKTIPTSYEYIPPDSQPLPEFEEATIYDNDQLIASEPEQPQSFMHSLKSKKSEHQSLKTAQQAYKTAYGPTTYLFIKHREQGWLPYPHKSYTSQELADIGYEAQRSADELLNNPLITDYKFTTDKYFPQRQTLRQQSIQSTLKQSRQNIQSAFRQTPQSRRSALEQSQAPSSLPRTPILGRRSPTSIMDSYSSNFPKPKTPYEALDSYEQQPMLDLSSTQERPAGFQEQSSFPLHTPYRPITFSFVGKPRKYQQFTPPFLRY